MSAHLPILIRGDIMDLIKRTFGDSAISEFTQHIRAPRERNVSEMDRKTCFTVLKMGGLFYKWVKKVCADIYFLWFVQTSVYACEQSNSFI